MKTLTVRLPEAMAEEIESESRASGMSKSDVVRRRLEAPDRTAAPAFFDLAADLIGSVDDPRMPGDLAARKKTHLEKRGYGKNRHR